MEQSPAPKEYPFLEFRKIKGGDMVAIFEADDTWGKREVAYNKHNLELRIVALKEKGQPSGEAERALSDWPK